MKRYILTLILTLPLFAACVEDKGSNDYIELSEISIDGIPAVVEALSEIENIVVSPTITSSTDGEITATNSDYTVCYHLAHKDGSAISPDGGKWLDITPESGLRLDIPADYPTGTYTCRLSVEDNRNGVVTSKYFDIAIGSTTYEGWLVLCNEGADERVRLDIISRLSSTRIETLCDITDGLPALHHATGIGFHPSGSGNGDLIALFSREGSYMLDNASFESDELSEYNLNRFLFAPGETMLKEQSFAASMYGWLSKFSFAFSENGNVYMQDHSSGSGLYSLPLNTTVAGTGPMFRVAPFAGYSWVRPWSDSYPANVLFYDADNRRFMGFLGGMGWDIPLLQMVTLPDPVDNMLFSFSTGRDMVYMEGTRRSNGLVYAILEDGVGRSIYGINMGGNGFVQEMYIENVDAPRFSEAEHFAFHSQFPIMFYSVGNKVYLYNLGTRTTKELTNMGLGESEEVTLLKFNLYSYAAYNEFSNQTEEFMGQQYNLLVGSYDNAATDVNNGKITFYSVDGVGNTVSELIEYDGFAKIADVIYRERL
jgi:hypothetical protein